MFRDSDITTDDPIIQKYPTSIAYITERMVEGNFTSLVTTSLTQKVKGKVDTNINEIDIKVGLSQDTNLDDLDSEKDE